MSSCCDNDQKSQTIQSKDSEKKPKGIINKFFWKIGKADAQKKQDNSQEQAGCC